ncbi:PspC domain-containing protein [Methanomicrobium antiquum]|uniref:PspC domain-containing protein n=1 Tax=Methanomicrobium antiquum TaxID=487686 RepID=A0AAF0FQ00_9EURY|nr:PspC domain-containing protein [Methanomicrobium antiquum]WFN35851.1 PspC domain-containing protein [Methanomicrobium antiquum]
MDKFYRSKDDCVIAGVCGGLGKKLDIDPNILRILWVLFCLFYGTGLIIYILAWIFLPEEEESTIINAEYKMKDN